jgi:hypothetical protein
MLILITLFISALLSIPIARSFEYLILYVIYLNNKNFDNKTIDFENNNNKTVTNNNSMFSARNGPKSVRRRMQDINPVEYQTTPQQLVSGKYNFSFSRVKPTITFDDSVNTFKCISFVCSVPLNVEIEMLQIRIKDHVDRLVSSDRSVKSQFLGIIEITYIYNIFIFNRYVGL